jgi:hypothetical protein
MTVDLAVWTGGLPECGGVEVEYVDPDRGRERGPLAVCWSSRSSGQARCGVSRHSGISGTGRAGGGSPPLASSRCSPSPQAGSESWRPASALAGILVCGWLFNEAPARDPPLHFSHRPKPAITHGRPRSARTASDQPVVRRCSWPSAGHRRSTKNAANTGLTTESVTRHERRRDWYAHSGVR